MRIIVLNSRDFRHPDAGGAERFTIEVACQWAQHGHEVTLLSSGFSAGPAHEEYGGVEIVRRGTLRTVLLEARRYLMETRANDTDVVVDEYTLFPFLTPLYWPGRIVLLVHELAREKWFYETSFPLNVIGFVFAEPAWLRLYRSIPTVTVSKSTERDLRRVGFTRVAIVSEGSNLPPCGGVPVKKEPPTFVYLGLLKRANLVDHAISAFSQVSKDFPDAALLIAGRGPDEGRLRAMARGLNVFFLGYVSEADKRRILEESRALLVPAVREGWGLVVIEANACGTPAIGYDVPGLRDSILDKTTGLLVDPTPAALASAMKRVLTERDFAARLSSGALVLSKSLTWTRTAEQFAGVLEVASR